MREDEVLVVVRDVLHAGATGPATDVSVVAEDLGRGGSGVDDYHVYQAEAEAD